MNPPAAYQRFCAAALKLAGVHQSTSYGMPSLKVQGRLLCRLRKGAPGILVLRCEFDDREFLLRRWPKVIFVTVRDLHRPVVLVRLERLSARMYDQLAKRTWELVAPLELRKQIKTSGRPRAQ